jgi:transglutaminase-like putative cysteine protease
VLIGCLVATAAAAQPPGGSVIRPGGSGAVPAAPEKKGYTVIRPGGRVPAAPRLDGEPAPAPKPAAKPDPLGGVLYEAWDACYLRGQRVGYYHTVVREHVKDGRTYRHGTRAQKLTVGRFGEKVEQWSEDSSVETLDGAVAVTVSRQEIGKGQRLTLTGTVKGRTLEVSVGGAVTDRKTIPWPDGVAGVAREAGILQARKPKPGESFDYLAYLGSFTAVVRYTVACKAVETVPLEPGQPPRQLVRLEQGMEPIGDFKLPTATIWCDPDSYEPLKLEQDMPMFGGRLVVRRTTRDEATKPITGPVPDLFDVQSIKLDKPIPDVHDRTSVVYRVAVAGDLPADRVFKADARQAVTAAGNPFELTVTAVRQPAPAADPLPAEPEFLGTSYFIDWDNPTVRQHAAAAVGDLPPSATPFQKAQAVERWVRRSMKPADYSQSMATCANTARTLSGDCTEYAMLAVGMCRALGVPARTAMGVVYAPAGGGAVLAYHMWFEVYAGGQWIPLDGTLGRGSVGPGHLKIADHSWDKVNDFLPLLPVISVLGAQPKVEVVAVK